MANVLKVVDVETVESVLSLNKYPKTDYTYSHLSRDRVELAPGQVAVPNMSRRSLSQFRIQGPNTIDETDKMGKTTAWTTSSVRKRFTTIDSSDDEGAYINSKAYAASADERWWITRALSAACSGAAAASRNAYRKIVGPAHRYPYTDRRPAKAGIASRAGSAAVAPFYWIYTVITTVLTTTVTAISETVSPKHADKTEKYVGHRGTAGKRRWWPWLLLLTLPVMGYGLHYTYENYDHLAMPNFTDFHLDLSELSAKLPTISLPNITLADLNVLPRINLTLPEINITLPDVRDNIPKVTKAYREYKEVVQNRMADASDYATVVAESCWEELRRFWRGVLG